MATTATDDAQTTQADTDEHTYNPAYVLVSLDLNEEATANDDGSVEASVTVTANNLTTDQVVTLLEETLEALKQNPDTLQDATVVL